ncbi:MAG: hypothetical protein ACYT04_35730 [Nostoc sp.]
MDFRQFYGFKTKCFGCDRSTLDQAFELASRQGYGFKNGKLMVTVTHAVTYTISCPLRTTYGVSHKICNFRTVYA